MKRRFFATCAAAFGLAFAGAVPAGALVNGEHAQPSPEADSVVKLVVPLNAFRAAECTGTAVDSQWVITAAHCVQDVPLKAGRVTVGQGEGARTVQINDWKVAPSGDVALVHVGEDLGLSSYSSIDRAGIGAGEVSGTVYGWSSLGEGASGRLPRASVKASACPTNYDLCANGDGILARTALPTALQQGDSGGPLFVDGRLVGMLSSAVSVDRGVNPESTGQYLYTSTNSLKPWIDEVLRTDPAQAPDPSAPDVEELPTVPAPMPVIPNVGSPSLAPSV